MDPPALCSATDFTHSISPFFPPHFPFFLTSLALVLTDATAAARGRLKDAGIKLYKRYKGSHGRHLPCWHRSKSKPQCDDTAPQCVGLRHRWQHFACMSFFFYAIIIRMCLHLMITHTPLPFMLCTGITCIQSIHKGLFMMPDFQKRKKPPKVPDFWFHSLSLRAFPDQLLSTDPSWTFLKFQSKGSTWQNKPAECVCAHYQGGSVPSKNTAYCCW